MEKETYSEARQATRDIAQAIVEEYHPPAAEGAEAAVKAVFGPIFESLPRGEMDARLGYQANEHGEKETTDRWNGHISRTVKTSERKAEIRVPRDQDATFEPQAVPKRMRDMSGIEGNILQMNPIFHRRVRFSRSMGLKLSLHLPKGFWPFLRV